MVTIGYVNLIFVLRLRENPEKNLNHEIDLTAIEPEPAALEVIMLPLNHSVGHMIYIYIYTECFKITLTNVWHGFLTPKERQKFI